MGFMADHKKESIRTIAAISRTCKRMRFEGTKYLLSGTVELGLIKDICSFCRFMLADRSSRLPLLKSLVLRLYSLEEEDHVGLVCEVLRGLSNLWKLDVTLDVNASPLVISAVPAAIASLTSLRVLRLFELGTSICPKPGDQIFVTALRNARAPLVVLCIWASPFVDALGAGVRYSRRRDPIFLCSCLRTTLEQLELHGGLILVVRHGRTYEYPHLKKLILPIYSDFMPYLKPFMVSAPHLRDLQFGGTYNSHTRHRHDEDILRGRIINQTRTAQEWRTTNEVDQEATGTCWSTLDSFKGAIISAYASGLSCPIARVHLLSTGGRRTTELAMLSIVLTDWRPSFLRLATKVYRARDYIPLLPSTTSGWAESLETLEIRLNIVDNQFDCARCFHHIGQMLSTLPTTSLRLEFRCVNSRRQDMEDRDPPFDPFVGEECERPGLYRPDAFCYTQDELLREDLPQRMRECMRSAGALRRMTIAWGRCWTRGPNRVLCVDLDNVPHVWDRAGDDSDGWGKPDRDW
ncbi:hypothetical protein OH76DRAFT_1410653 [Lentinus brumalis]|uniref:F-box domain-containing protein n=1 Tax=Lentinus brumalis TaxID=2498619 RepID=A0A371CRJ0_9APHY|nr:hypothetical protein OH76DRAFT_1410653 [Polyporus brumalis]